MEAVLHTRGCLGASLASAPEMSEHLPHQLWQPRRSFDTSNALRSESQPRAPPRLSLPACAVVPTLSSGLRGWSTFWPCSKPVHFFLCWRRWRQHLRGAWPRSHPGLSVPDPSSHFLWAGAQSSTSAGLTSTLKWNSVSVLRSFVIRWQQEHPFLLQNSVLFFFFFPLYTFRIPCLI